MPVTHTLAAAFTQSIGKTISLPAGSQTNVFFGTAGDGIETNRVVGGPALSVIQGTPVHATNYVSVGVQSAANCVIDTMNLRDASWIASGWTCMAVARTTGQSTNYVSCISDQNATGAPGQAGSIFGFGLRPTNNQLVLFGNGMSQRGVIQFTNPIATTWHCCGYIVPATAASGLQTTAYEFTENQAGQSVSFTITTTGVIPTPAMSPHFGPHSIESGVGQGPMDIAWGYVCKGVLTQVQMAALAASVRPWLARRGIVC